MNMYNKSISIAITALLALSFLALIPIAVHAQTLDTSPTVVPQLGTFEAGSTITNVGVTFGYVTGDSYTIQLYSSPVDSCLNSVGMTPLGLPVTVAAYAGTPSPVTGFSFVAPSTNLYVCAEVTDTTLPNTGLWSGPASYTVVPPLSSYINNDENAVTVDLGQAFILTDYVSGGAGSYTYQWYYGSTSATCTTPVGTPDTSPSATSASYTPSPAGMPITTGTVYYNVEVTDGSMTPSSACEGVTVTVNPEFTGSFVVDGVSGTGVINDQIGSPNFQALIDFEGGTPWYSVSITMGTDSICAKDTTPVKSADDITANMTILSFPEPSTPSSTTYYCAVLYDSAGSVIDFGPVTVNTSPALTAPTLTISPNQADYNIPTVFGATVSWAGGTAPYYVVLTSGSSSSCAAPDNTPVVEGLSAGNILSGPLLGPFGGLLYPAGGHTGSHPVVPDNFYADVYSTYFPLPYNVFATNGTTMSFFILSPTSTTYYCAIVFDSSSYPSAPSQTYTLAAAQFNIEGLFAVNSPSLLSTLTEGQSPYYEGISDTATVTWSGGTGPFYVELYTATSADCSGILTPVTVWPGSNPQTGITGTADKAVFTFLVPSAVGTYYYCATVTDVNGNTVSNGAGPILAPGTALTVAAPLTSVPIAFTPPTVGIDTGQTETLTITVGLIVGGSPPYTVTLYSGTSTNCAADTTKVGTPQITNTGTTIFTFTSPTAGGTINYCAGVVDSSVPPSTGSSTTLPFSTLTPPTVTLTGLTDVSGEIAAGTSTTLTAAGSGGVGTLYYTWFIGAGCVAGTVVYGPSISTTYKTGVISTDTTYSVQVSDSSTGKPAATDCASLTVTTDNGPIGVATVPSGPFAGEIFVNNPWSFGSIGANSTSVLNSDSNQVVTTIPLALPPSWTGVFPIGNPVNPWGVATDATNGVVYVTGHTTFLGVTIGVLCVISMATLTVTACVQVGTNPEGVAVSSLSNEVLPDTGMVYVANNGDNTVSVFDTPVTAISTSAAVVNVGPGPMNVAVDPNTYSVWVTDNGGNTVSVLQPRAWTGAIEEFTYAVTTVTVGFEPVGVAIESSPDAAVVANSGSGTVSVISGTTFNTLSTIKIGSTPPAIPTGVDIVGSTAYVANAATGSVYTINLKTYTPSSSGIAVGTNPFGVAADVPDNSIFITNQASNTVSVIDLTSGLVVATTVVP